MFLQVIIGVNIPTRLYEYQRKLETILHVEFDSSNGSGRQENRQNPILEQQFYRLDGQTCQISKKDTPGESDEEVDDATRHESDNLILVYILGNTMGITP